MDTLKNVVMHLADPWLMLAASAAHLPQTVAGLVSSGDARALLSPRAVSDALFGRFWATIGPDVKRVAEARAVPLLEGRVAGGRVHADVVGAPLHGAVVEVGAGSGMWADVFARVGRRRLTAVYGVEPNPACAAELRRRVDDAGLGAVYEVVPLGIEAVAKAGRIPPASVDCIVCVLSLCSVPDPEASVAHLYELLRPGGRLYVYEHVKATRGGLLLGLYQRLVDIPWPFFVGSCRVCRPTDKMLRAAGPWHEIDLAQPPDEPPYQVLPHILGTLTK